MAYTSIIFKNAETSATKEAPVGFSWTSLFFGFFPAVFRADWKWAFIQMIVQVFTLGLSTVVFSVIYNKLYIKELINAGFKAQSIANDDMDFANATVGMQIPMLDDRSEA